MLELFDPRAWIAKNAILTSPHATTATTATNHSHTVATVATVAGGYVENEKTECPLRKLNRCGFFVEPTAAGLTLHCDFTINESTEAHVILWTLGKWDALINALGEPGQIPKRVTVKSHNLYELPR